eukprot:1183810-Prorocentrum_minimum.AAC.1
MADLEDSLVRVDDLDEDAGQASQADPKESTDDLIFDLSKSQTALVRQATDVRHECRKTKFTASHLLSCRTCKNSRKSGGRAAMWTSCLRNCSSSSSDCDTTALTVLGIATVNPLTFVASNDRLGASKRVSGTKSVRGLQIHAVRRDRQGHGVPEDSFSRFARAGSEAGSTTSLRSPSASVQYQHEGESPRENSQPASPDGSETSKVNDEAPAAEAKSVDDVGSSRKAQQQGNIERNAEFHQPLKWRPGGPQGRAKPFESLWEQTSAGQPGDQTLSPPTYLKPQRSHGPKRASSAQKPWISALLGPPLAPLPEDAISLEAEHLGYVASAALDVKHAALPSPQQSDQSMPSVQAAPQPEHESSAARHAQLVSSPEGESHFPPSKPQSAGREPPKTGSAGPQGERSASPPRL